MYRLIKDEISGSIRVVLLIATWTSIPFAPDNTDYQCFKADVLAGAELQDAEGNVMTQEAATAFIETLP